MITGVHTIIVQTSDMDRSVAFYRDVLKLAPGYTSPYWSDFVLGSHRLGIHPLMRDGIVVQPFANAVIGVETANLSELRSALETAGDYVSGSYHQTPSGVVLDFVDPEGNNWQALQVGSKLKDFD